MTIETKFSIGDPIFFMYENRAVQDTVDIIKTSNYTDGSGGITYTTKLYYKGNNIHFREEDNLIFSTKEELLNTL